MNSILLRLLIKTRLLPLYCRFTRFLLKIQGRLMIIKPRGYHDEVVVQHAIDYVAERKRGPRIVELIGGNYYIEDTINLESYLTLVCYGAILVGE